MRISKAKIYACLFIILGSFLSNTVVAGAALKAAAAKKAADAKAAAAKKAADAKAAAVQKAAAGKADALKGKADALKDAGAGKAGVLKGKADALKSKVAEVVEEASPEAEDDEDPVLDPATTSKIAAASQKLAARAQMDTDKISAFQEAADAQAEQAYENKLAELLGGR